MIKNGTRPNKVDHRDYDFLKTHRFKGIQPPKFENEYLCDAGLTMPDQNVFDDSFAPPVPAMPEGCTNECTADITTDLTGTVHSPDVLEAVTHANARGGYDIRMSLMAAVKIGWLAGFFNIRAYAPLDYFDAFRLAQISGLPEKRSIEWGTPWFPSWSDAINGTMQSLNPDGSHKLSSGGEKSAVMPMPTADELAQLRANPLSFPWHDSKLDGWTTKNGILVYRDKSWQGKNIGEGGFIYFPREVINVVMDIKGTVAFTGTRMGIGDPQHIDVTVVQWIVSLVRQLMGYQY